VATKTTTEDRFWKVVGTELQDDGTVRHYLKQVADSQGTPLAVVLPSGRSTYDTPPAQEQPRGTVVQITIRTDVTRTVTTFPAP
jgi:hypothetical protein